MRVSLPSRLPRWQRPSFGPVKPLARIYWDCGGQQTFQPDDVPDEDVHTILALAAQAPSGFNLQPWRFVVVREQEQRDRLGQAARNHAAVAGAPVVIVAYGRRESWREFAGTTPCGSAPAGSPSTLFANEEITVWLHRHVMVAFTYMMISAEALGWDTIPMESLDSPIVCHVLGLPADAEVVAMLAIGRLEDQGAPAGERLPLEKLACAEYYGTPWRDPAGEV